MATGNTLLTIAHALFSDPTADYHDLGADWYEARTQHRRQVATHLRGLQRLGYKVTLNPQTKSPELATTRTSGLRPERGSAPHPGPPRPKNMSLLQVIFGPDQAKLAHVRAPVAVVISSAFWGVSSVNEGAFLPRRRRVIYSGVFT